LLLFFIRISELYEEKLNPLLSEDPQFRTLAEMLIAIYSSLLELTCCPDRNEVLTNSGILSYQLGHYATAAETYSQITSQHHMPALSLSLAYAHLIEPTLALKYVQQACQMEPKDRVNLFCKDVL
jgi:tetratricopeptide (TPR) repeat protein